MSLSVRAGLTAIVAVVALVIAHRLYHEPLFAWIPFSTTPYWLPPTAISVPPPCSQPFTWEEGNCMVRLGDLNFELQVRGKHLPTPLDSSSSSDTPIIFPSPGWGLDCGLKFAGLEPLFPSHTFLCMVVRGNYPSDRPPKEIDMTSTAMAHDLELLRMYLDLPRLRLYAHSIGGTIALGYAELYPSHAASLVLVDAKMLDHDDTPTLMQFVRDRAADPRFSASIAALKISANFSDPAFPKNDPEYRHLLLDLLPWYFSRPELHLPHYARQVQARPLASNWALIAHDKANIRDPTPNKALLGTVVAPTLIIVGEHDAFCTKKVAEIMHAGIRDSELVVYDECGNLPWVERKEDFTRKLEEWWSKY